MPNSIGNLPAYHYYATEHDLHTSRLSNVYNGLQNDPSKHRDGFIVENRNGIKTVYQFKMALLGSDIRIEINRDLTKVANSHMQLTTGVTEYQERERDLNEINGFLKNTKDFQQTLQKVLYGKVPTVRHEQTPPENKAKVELTEKISRWLKDQVGGDLNKKQAYQLLAYTHDAGRDAVKREGIAGFSAFEQNLRREYKERERGEFSTAMREVIFSLASSECKETYIKILEQVVFDHNRQAYQGTEVNVDAYVKDEIKLVLWSRPEHKHEIPESYNSIRDEMKTELTKLAH